jgi:predicted amidohydrolase
VNRVGHEHGDILGNKATGPGLQFWGGSFLADPFGRVVAKASHDAEEILLGETGRFCATGASMRMHPSRAGFSIRATRGTPTEIRNRDGRRIA